MGRHSTISTSVLPTLTRKLGTKRCCVRMEVRDERRTPDSASADLVRLAGLVVVDHEAIQAGALLAELKLAIYTERDFACRIMVATASKT